MRALHYTVFGAQVALLALAAFLMAAGASHRTPLTVGALQALVFAVGAAAVLDSWRRGHLTKRIGEIHAEARSGRLDSALSNASFWFGVAALVFVSLT